MKSLRVTTKISEFSEMLLVFLRNRKIKGYTALELKKEVFGDNIGTTDLYSALNILVCNHKVQKSRSKPALKLAVNVWRLVPRLVDIKHLLFDKEIK